MYPFATRVSAVMTPVVNFTCTYPAQRHLLYVPLYRRAQSSAPKHGRTYPPTCRRYFEMVVAITDPLEHSFLAEALLRERQNKQERQK